MTDTLDLRPLIRTVPNFPKPGVQFRDVTTLFKDPRGFRAVVERLAQPYAGRGVDKVAGIESRGFIVGAAVASELRAGFVPIRKAGKLPAENFGQDYELEYGTDRLEVHRDAFLPGERVLLVDDERLLRRVLRTLLEHEGYAVCEASDGLEALEVLTAPGATVDLVLLDHSMPHLSGAETLRRLRARGSCVKVIGYSGLDAPMEGADAMLLKPAMPEALLAAIRAALDAATQEET